MINSTPYVRITWIVIYKTPVGDNTPFHCTELLQDGNDNHGFKSFQNEGLDVQLSFPRASF